MKRKLFQKGASALLMLTIASGAFMKTSEASVVTKNMSKSAQLLENWYENYQVYGNSFEEGDNLGGDIVYSQAQTYYCGRKIWVITARKNSNITAYNVSIGYRARRTLSNGKEQKGFVTCAHVLRSSVDKKVYTSKTCKTAIGTIEKTCYGGSRDFAFVKTNSASTISPKTRDGSTTLGPYVTSVSKGDKVNMCGGVSGTLKNKEVTNTSASAYLLDPVTCDSTYFSGLIATKPMSKAGDSGGVVYKLTSTGKPYIVGIVIAGDTEKSYVMKESAIRSSLNAVPY